MDGKWDKWLKISVWGEMHIVLHNWLAVRYHKTFQTVDKRWRSCIWNVLSSYPSQHTYIVQLKLQQAKPTLMTPSESEIGLLFKISKFLVQAIKKSTKLSQVSQVQGSSETGRLILIVSIWLFLLTHPLPLFSSHLILKSQGFCCWLQTKQIKLKTWQSKYVVDRIPLNYPTVL